VLYADTCPSKEEQERGIGGLLLDQYEALSGAPLTGNTAPPQDPPDRLFQWSDLVVGVEMFEVPRFYEDRAFHDGKGGVVDHIYAEFERRDVGDRYVGMSVRIMDGRYRRAEQIKAELKGRLRQAAIELVDLVMQHVPTREHLPATRPSPTPNTPSISGRRSIKADADATSALAVIATDIDCSRTVGETIFRSDGRAAPRVISGGIATSAEEIAGIMAATIRNKMARRLQPHSGWEGVQHAILVAHDLPRGRIYQYGFRYADCLRAAASATGVVPVFDEVLFVTVESGSWTAHRIAGGQPSGGL
jgi:hypothetical protein